MPRARRMSWGVVCLAVCAVPAAHGAPVPVGDDTAAVQALLDAAAPGGTVTLPPGRTYVINLAVGLRPRSHSRVRLHGVTLQGTLGAGQGGRFFDLTAKSRVTLMGGTLLGSRTAGPAWSHGVIAANASNVVLEDMTFQDIFTDGVLLTGSPGSTRVTLRNCRFLNGRRSGLYVTAGREISVEDCSFENTNGLLPEAGLYVQAAPGAVVEHLRVGRSLFRGNRGPGLSVAGAPGASIAHLTLAENTLQQNQRGVFVGQASHVVIEGNRISGHPLPPQAGLALGRDTWNAAVNGNVLENNYRGILADGASLVNIEGNTVIGTGARAGLNAGLDGDGITCGAAGGAVVSSCSVTGNVVTRSAGIGIRLRRGSLMMVASNVVTESGQAGISLVAVDDSQVRGNTVSRSSLESARSHDDIHVGAAALRNLVTFNQCRYGGAARASVYVSATSAYTLVAENSLLGGAGFANLSATTSVNWDGSPASWNR